MIRRESGRQEVFGFDSCWPQSVALRLWVEPDLVTSRGLATKLEASRLHLANDVAVAKAGKTSHVQAATTMV